MSGKFASEISEIRSPFPSRRFHACTCVYAADNSLIRIIGWINSRDAAFTSARIRAPREIECAKRFTPVIAECIYWKTLIIQGAYKVRRQQGGLPRDSGRALEMKCSDIVANNTARILDNVGRSSGIHCFFRDDFRTLCLRAFNDELLDARTIARDNRPRSRCVTIDKRTRVQ